MFALLVRSLLKYKEKHLQVMMPATHLFWECMPLGPGIALRGLHRWEELFHFYEFQGSVALGLMLQGHAGGSLPLSFSLPLGVSPNATSAGICKVFGSFCSLGCWHLWNVGQL